MSDSETGYVSIQASDAATELFLINHHFERIASGRGSLQAKVAPGLYKIRTRSGDGIHDQHIDVLPGEALEIAASTVSFRATPPLVSSTTTHEYHMYPARDLSRLEGRSPKVGSRLFVFLRDEHTPPRPVPDARLDLLTFDGFPVEGIGLESSEKEGWAGFTVDLEPGTYRVRWKGGPRVSESLFVTTVKGWETHVFIAMALPAVGDASGEVVRPDFSTASIQMAELGSGFDAARSSYRTSELARLALFHRRFPIRHVKWLDDPADLDENPMLVLYTAYLLLRQATNLDIVALDVLIRPRLEGLRGHPDVLALSRIASRDGTRLVRPLPGRDRAIRGVPSLWEGWEAIRASVESGTDEPPSFSASDLARTARPAGIWVLKREVMRRPQSFMGLMEVGPPAGNAVDEVTRMLSVDPPTLAAALRDRDALGFDMLQAQLIATVWQWGSSDELDDPVSRASRLIEKIPANESVIAAAAHELLSVIDPHDPQASHASYERPRVM